MKKRNQRLLIERRGSNFGIAAPAGHQDGQSPAAAARKELKEEVGLAARKLVARLKIKLNNPCRRTNNQFHVWTVFEAARWQGRVKRSKDETKRYFWASPRAVKSLADKLERFARAQRIPLAQKNLRKLQMTANRSRVWKKNPGLEPPMYFLFKELGII
ncbi:MAG: NUDIX hydrolase [Candidatus Sungbacteria bacterium]|nr:NUDIX hydrolase [Candidatus Sungbacteria bacterium]